MPGLIPLMLNPVVTGNRSSVVFAPSQPTKQHARGRSMNFLPMPAQLPHSPPYSPTSSPTFPQRSSLPAPPRPKAAKRLSLASPSPLPALPYTQDDWRRSVAEVKRQHMNRRYRACFTRCTEILDNIKDTADVEPAYLISLHFYAATAIEMCARPLSAPSAYRDGLFQKARSHYDRASGLIRQAEELVHLKTRMSFSLLSSPGLHSPSGSVSSRASSTTGFSSPTPSVCSSEDLDARLRQSHSPPPSILGLSSRPARKKVSFELPKEGLPRWEPYIRPDSPTLGFDDEYFTAALSRQVLPEIPSRARSPDDSRIVHPVCDEDVTPRASRVFSQTSQDYASVDATPVRHSYAMENSASRYCAHLASLKAQMARHRADLDTILDAAADDKEDYTCHSPMPADDDEAKALERKARIERLRKVGWQRKRFDPSRYEALRNAALADLS